MLFRHVEEIVSGERLTAGHHDEVDAELLGFLDDPVEGDGVDLVAFRVPAGIASGAGEVAPHRRAYHKERRDYRAELVGMLLAFLPSQVHLVDEEVHKASRPEVRVERGENPLGIPGPDVIGVLESPPRRLDLRLVLRRPGEGLDDLRERYQVALWIFRKQRKHMVSHLGRCILLHEIVRFHHGASFLEQHRITQHVLGCRCRPKRPKTFRNNTSPGYPSLRASPTTLPGRGAHALPRHAGPAISLTNSSKRLLSWPLRPSIWSWNFLM